MTQKDQSQSDLVTHPFRVRRWREAAVVLPLVGVALFTTPILRIFTSDMAILGIPMAFLFVYGAWIGLIILGRLLAHRLRDDSDT